MSTLKPSKAVRFRNKISYCSQSFRNIGPELIRLRDLKRELLNFSSFEVLLTVQTGRWERERI